MNSTQQHDESSLRDWFAQNLVQEKGADGARTTTAQASGFVRAAVERAISRQVTARAPNDCTDEFNNAALALAQEQNPHIPEGALPVVFQSTIEMSPPQLGKHAPNRLPGKAAGAGFLTLPGTLQAVGFALWNGAAFEHERWYAMLDSHDLPHPTGKNVWGDPHDQWASDEGGDL